MNALKLFVGRKASSNITQNEYNRSVDFLSQMVGRASEIGMQVFGEMHENTLFDSVEGCFRVLKDLNHPNLRICFQPYDFTDTARMLADYECVSEYVSHIHFQGRRRGAFVDLCHAELDYPSLFDTMATHTFAGYACLEFVKGCVVPSADLFNLDVVLQSAIRDRDYLTRQFALRGL
jgi:sugar phosphate isomerase/epimerase